MADHSAIEWTDATWNPLRGCSRVSAGCQHCYAEGVAARFSGPGLPYEGLIHPTTRGWNGKIRLVPEVMDQPIRWKRPRRIFVNSMSDLFHEWVPDSYIAAVFAVMAATPHHVYQILTKRPGRMLLWLKSWMQASPYPKMHECLKGVIGYHHPRRPAITDGPWPLPNVWLGVSVENQVTADERIPLLLQCPAAVRWLSCEPLLGRVDLCDHLGMWWNQTMGCFEGNGPRINASRFAGQQSLGWVVAGGESGRGARPMHPDWARSLREQCAAAGVPFFFKQWGEWAPTDRWSPYAGAPAQIAIDRQGAPVDDDVNPDAVGGQRFTKLGKKGAGRLLDGAQHNAYPEVRA
jgi:protein gp37